MSHAPTAALDRRHRIIRDDLSARSLDALVVTSLPNILYLTNFTGSTAIAVVTPDARPLPDRLPVRHRDRGQRGARRMSARTSSS